MCLVMLSSHEYSCMIMISIAIGRPEIHRLLFRCLWFAKDWVLGMQAPVTLRLKLGSNSRVVSWQEIKHKPTAAADCVQLCKS